VRLLWVLRDLLGVNGPKYGCGLDVCKACTSHINGKAFNPCSPVSDIKATDEIVTIEGLPATVGKPLHPMQQAWLDFDVAQCGYCQPGQIMDAVALVNEAIAAGRPITTADFDSIRNVCRCGTYLRIREAIRQGAAEMATDKQLMAKHRKPSKHNAHHAKKHHPTKHHAPTSPTR
jgi:isoquinoline 1-oxidoreductase alpha subunit